MFIFLQFEDSKFKICKLFSTGDFSIHVYDQFNILFSQLLEEK